MNEHIRNITLTALLIAIGILLPVVFHMVSLGGPMFLPMHLPVIIAGFLLPWQFAALVGAVTPLLSSFLTGMPPMPGALTMVAELTTYAIVTSLLYRHLRKGIYGSMILAMVSGRLVSIIANWALLTLVLGQPFKITSFLYTMFAVGLPGIVFQLIVIPPLVTLILHAEAQQKQKFSTQKG
ncbi:ECF transporter S component [Coprothermobacter platensis]|uniref:ECF transporter S component n=1 Tax=Coprothermobacter platensis TaxID=108819 RepID=UPI0003693EF5|nr:ECF transporter S component [Coprothermobacter platensis]